MNCDVHSHILMRMDDGSDSERTTEAVLSSLKRAGISNIALTPHFYPTRRSLSDFVSEREAEFRKMLLLPGSSGMRFTLGAEVYLSDALFNYEDISPLCYRGTDLMLTEPEYGKKFTSSVERNINKLIDDYRITPVIAHIDRYPGIISDRGVLEYLRSAGCLFQINTDALYGFFSSLKVIRAMENGYFDFSGNDLHKAPLDCKRYKKAEETIQKKFGAGMVKKLEKNAGKLFL